MSEGLKSITMADVDDYIQTITDDNALRLIELVDTIPTEYGKIEVLDGLKRRGYRFKSHHIEVACSAGHTNIVQWFLENDCDPENLSLYIAVENNNIPMAGLLLKYGLEFDYDMVKLAAKKGYVEMLLLMEMSGCEYVVNCSDAAATGNQVKILQILYALGVKFGLHDMVCAAKHGSLDALKYFVKECKMGSEIEPIVYQSAVSEGRNNITIWLTKHGYGPLALC